MLGKADMDAPASKPREDSPASGPSPEVQVPGKMDPETLAFIRSNAIGAALLGAVLGVKDEPIPADDEQVEGAA